MKKIVLVALLCAANSPLLAFAAVLAIYGLFGWLDVGNFAQGGWATDPDNTVAQVLAGSPTEAAGLQVGDKIISMGGIAGTDAEAQTRRARPEVGETWEFVVERDGATVSERESQGLQLMMIGALVGLFPAHSAHSAHPAHSARLARLARSCSAC